MTLGWLVVSFNKRISTNIHGHFELFYFYIKKSRLLKD